MNFINKDQSIRLYLEENYKRFTTTQKNISNYIISNLYEIAFLNADDLASRVNTTPSSIVRFAKAIGFHGFPELQKKIQEVVLGKIESMGQLERAKRFKLKNSKSAIFTSLLKDISSLEHLIKLINEENIKEFSKIIISSEKKFIIANRGSFSVGHFLYFELKKILENCIFINDLDGCFFDNIRVLNKNDLVIAISFPRYSTKTKRFVEYSKKKNVTVLSITNNKTSPLYSLSNLCLFCPVEVTTFFSSKVAPLAVVNAIICEIFFQNYKKSVHNIENEEQILLEMNVVDSKSFQKI